MEVQCHLVVIVTGILVAPIGATSVTLLQQKAVTTIVTCCAIHGELILQCLLQQHIHPLNMVLQYCPHPPCNICLVTTHPLYMFCWNTSCSILQQSAASIATQLIHLSPTTLHVSLQHNPSRSLHLVATHFTTHCNVLYQNMYSNA